MATGPSDGVGAGAGRANGRACCRGSPQPGASTTLIAKRGAARESPALNHA